MLSLGKEAPAIRIKTLSGEDNVIGSLADGIQLICYANDYELAKKLLEMLDIKAEEFKKLIPTIVLDKNDNYVFDNKKTKIVVDFSGDYVKKYGCGVFSIDDDGLVVYADEDKNFDACFEKIAPLLVEKKKKHTHEDWMRSY